jgi:hypothetical protein
MLFSSVSLLGLYLSLALLIRDRSKGRQRTFLGLYLASLSMLLLYMCLHAHSVQAVNPVIDVLGIIPLFLIGPFSFKLRQGASKPETLFPLLFQFLPAIIIGICLTAGWVTANIVYMLGLLHTGFYFGLQFFWAVPREILDNQHAAVQLTLFLGISILCFASPGLNHHLIASLGLALLILHIWMRLLYAAYISYIVRRS